LRSDRGAEVLAFLQGDESRMRRVCASIGDVWDAYEVGWKHWLKDEKCARRNLNDLALVIAHALDFWTVNEGGRRGTKVGAEVPDLVRIRALSVGRLNKDLVRGYFLSRQVEAEIAAEDEAGKPMLMWREAEEHAAINSTLDHACDVFSSSAREHAFDRVKLPDLTEFLKAKRLPEGEALPSPFSSVEFAALVAAFAAVREAEPELWLLDTIHRQTGMRPVYVMGLRGSWLVQGEAGQWYIELRARPEEGFAKKRGTLNQFIPITPALRDLIAAQGHGLTIAGTATTTARLALRKRHNAMIKATVNDEGSHGQGAYRYRDTVASILAHLRGVDAAQWALGHTTSTTTLRHYARALPGVSDLMQSELSAWLTARKAQ
jgi:integrase